MATSSLAAASVVPALGDSRTAQTTAQAARVVPEPARHILVVALRTTLVTLVLTGLMYPLVMTGLAQGIFPKAASGSLVTNGEGKVVGSRWIGQGFTGAGYFQPRPSAAGAGFDATSSGGSNFGPTSAKLRDRVKADVARLRHDNPEAPALVPAELVTASASGLDPDLSPGAATWQVARVARARGLDAERVRTVLADQIEGRDLGFLGEPHVNVLLLNLALDRQFGAPRAK
jgi:K+-transporting ATPase ATPase C chain